MRAEVLIEAIGDAYEKVKLDNIDLQKELEACKQALLMLQSTSTAEGELQKEASSSSKTESQESPKKSAKRGAKKASVQKLTKE